MEERNRREEEEKLSRSEEEEIEKTLRSMTEDIEVPESLKRKTWNRCWPESSMPGRSG